MRQWADSSSLLLSRPWVFFSLALGWSWLCWTPLALLGLGLGTPAGLICGLLGLLGPGVAGITCTYLTQGNQGRRDYWTRVIDVKRVGAKWYATIFLFVPILFALAVLLDILSGGTGGQWEESALRIAAQPWAIVPIALGIFFVGPLEEFGWRGYVQDRLQEHRSALMSSLILGPIWSVWHLPLFFIPGTYQQGLGVGSLSFWLFMIGIVPLTVIFTWIYNHTNRSTFAIMVFHFMVNFTGQMVAFTKRADVYSIVLWLGAAVGVSLASGSQMLRPHGSTATGSN